MKKALYFIVRFLIGIVAVVTGLFGIAVVFIIALPLVWFGKIKKFIKRKYENNRRLFNCSVVGSWIYIG